MGFRLFAGAQLDRPPGPKYVAQLPFAELVFRGAPPKVATLERWRATVPENFQAALVVPKSTVCDDVGAYRPGEALDAGVEWLLEAKRVTKAKLVLPTFGLTTSARDRERAASLIARLGMEDVVWAPSGLWEAEQAHPFAAELGVTCAFDPLVASQSHVSLPAGDTLYARLPAIGARQRFGEGVLEELLDVLLESGVQDAFVAIASPRSIREAVNLVRLASEL